MSVLSCLIEKVTSTDVRIINILQRLPHKMAENSWYEEITSLSPYVHVYNKSTHSPIKRNILWHKINTKKLKPGLVASYDREGLFWFWRFINLSLTYLVRHLSTYSPRTHMEAQSLILSFLDSLTNMREAMLHHLQLSFSASTLPKHRTYRDTSSGLFCRPDAAIPVT